MSYSISTLLIRKFRDVFGENDPRASARPSTTSSLKIVCSTTPAKESTVAVTRSIASPARSRLLTLTFNISQLPSPRNRAMAGWSDGYRVDLVRRQLTPELISSLPRTGGSPPSIYFSTSFRKVHSALRKSYTRIWQRKRTRSIASAEWRGNRRRERLTRRSEKPL